MAERFERKKKREVKIPFTLPLLPLREMVVFPHMIIPLFVGREKSLKSLDEAMLHERFILLVAQKAGNIERPTPNDIFDIGTVAEVLQLLKLPDGTTKILVEGISRAKIMRYLLQEKFFQVRIERTDETILKTAEMEGLMRSVTSQFEDYVRLNRKVPPETLMSVINIEEPGRLADTIAAHLTLKTKDKQVILEALDPTERLERLAQILNRENEILGIEKRIRERVKKQMTTTQKEYYLSEQLRAIQKELGRKGGVIDEFTELKNKIKKAKMSKEAQENALKEVERLSQMPSLSAEAAVIRNYVDWLISLPWAIETQDKLDITEAEKILEEDHYDLKKPKERILEYLAVRKLVEKMKGPILCFVGPPGCGKTSLARSIARALGRNFVRISLGGVRDEAEIRGHRRTYIGALPGRVIQAMKKAKSRNPVFLLDEIDKVGKDFRGDPAAALLEVLDPEENKAFGDHYLEVDFDLSKVLFVTTANIRDFIHPTLLDRMEIIEFPGYTQEEKLKIAQEFLVSKQLQAHGLTKKNLSFSPTSLLHTINRYTMEAGVRNLEREIATICRKVAKEVARKDKSFGLRVGTKAIEKFLGPPKYRPEEALEKKEIGVATGLVIGPAGGELATIEATVMSGKGEKEGLVLTGRLREVMQESARAALSYIRSRAESLGIASDFYKNVDIHIHVPKGAIPKDGPSAGITMAVALASALTKRRVKNNVAMTGEITLRGRVLEIGGVKEKVLAAHRANIPIVILPKENEKELTEIPANIKRRIKFVLVENMDEVLKVALEKEKVS
ncbi:endopeptidase La [bacterium]|nr:endopeptidase La [bacterium]MBU4560669.1 endopeptidase La [bacterium]